MNFSAGLEYIYKLTQEQNTKLRIEMKIFTEETIYYAEYKLANTFIHYHKCIFKFLISFLSNFYIDNEASYYKLHYGDYSGNAGGCFKMNNSKAVYF